MSARELDAAGITDPALREILAEEDITPQPAYVYEVRGEMDPAGCADLGEEDEEPAS